MQLTHYHNFVEEKLSDCTLNQQITAVDQK